MGDSKIVNLGFGCIRHFTSPLEVKLVPCLCCKRVPELCALAWFHAPRDQLNAKDTDMEQALLLCYITTKVLVKCCIVVGLVCSSHNKCMSNLIYVSIKIASHHDLHC